jgi:hypothetical protein
MPRPKDFIFSRKLEEDTAEKIFYVVENVLEDADYFSLVQPKDMHLSLVHQSMLINRKTPKRFNPNYSHFDSNRRLFVRGECGVSPWDEGAVRYLGTEMLKYTMAIKTDSPAWLRNEQKRIMQVSGISRNILNYDIDLYRPHISLAYFVGETRDLKYVQETEAELDMHLRDIGEIILRPLELKSEIDNWTFTADSVIS